MDGAWTKVNANAGGAGVDGRTVAQTAGLLGEHKETLLERIRRMRRTAGPAVWKAQGAQSP